MEIRRHREREREGRKRESKSVGWDKTVKKRKKQRLLSFRKSFVFLL